MIVKTDCATDGSFYGTNNFICVSTGEPAEEPVVVVLAVEVFHHELQQRLGHLLPEDQSLLEVVLQLVNDLQIIIITILITIIIISIIILT